MITPTNTANGQAAGGVNGALGTCAFRPGLEGIPAVRSSISYVDGKQGILEYRGIPIDQLAQEGTFLECTYLLIWGNLPTEEQLANFKTDIQCHRRLKFRIRDMMKCFP
ncbi:MAG: citrate/2-methylcitrate synthase, partial [Cyanobacteria bacterium P01_H01_bin.130]